MMYEQVLPHLFFARYSREVKIVSCAHVPYDGVEGTITCYSYSVTVTGNSATVSVTGYSVIVTDYS